MRWTPTFFTCGCSIHHMFLDGRPAIKVGKCEPHRLIHFQHGEDEELNADGLDTCDCPYCVLDRELPGCCYTEPTLWQHIARMAARQGRKAST